MILDAQGNNKKTFDIMTASSTDENKTDSFMPFKTEIRVYKKRWLILTLFTGQVIVISMLTNCIGIIDDVYKAYFDISMNTIDWFTLIQSPAMILSAIVLTVLSFNSALDSQKLLTMVSICAVISCLFSILSSAYPPFYRLIFFGQFVSGFGAQASGAINSVLATTWFPENQIGFAISFTAVGKSIGYSLSFIVPSYLFDSKPRQDTSNNATEAAMQIWRDQTLYKFLVFYGILLFLSAVMWFLFYSFATNVPPSPPTLAQFVLRQQNSQDRWKEAMKSLASLYSESVTVLMSKLGIQTAILLSVLYSCNNLQKLLLSDIVRAVFLNDEFYTNADAMSGHVLVLFEMGCLLGSIFSGKLVDYFKRHSLILFVYLFLCSVSMIGLAAARYYVSIPATIVFNILLGISICSCYVPIYDMLLEHTYPKNPVFIMSLFAVECLPATILFGEAAVLLLQYVSGTAVLVFMCLFVFLCLFLSIFLKPDYRRQKASKSKLTNGFEILPLMFDN